MLFAFAIEIFAADTQVKFDRMTPQSYLQEKTLSVRPSSHLLWERKEGLS